MRRAIGMGLLVVVALVLATKPAHADVYQYAFKWIGGEAGTISGNGPFTGSGIGIDELDITDETTATLLHTYAITGGSLDFDTSTGAISIHGNTVGFGSGTLFSGMITSLSAPPNCGPNDRFCSLNFDGTSTLGAFLGSTMGGNDSAPKGGPWTAYSNSITVYQTPEPASLLLLAFGLMGLRSLRIRGTLQQSRKALWLEG